MRLTEITKDVFVARLKDPEKAQTLRWAKEIENQLLGIWTVEVVDSPENFYSDHTINMKYRGDTRKLNKQYLRRQVNIVATIVPEHVFYKVYFDIDGYDIQIEVVHGREALYKGREYSYTPIYTDT